MGIRASLIIAAYNRDNLLKQCLPTIIRQSVDQLEIFVCDEAETPVTTKSLIDKYRDTIKYLHTGQTKELGRKWRVPGFAFNIGVKQTVGDVLILSSAEIYHVDDCLEPMIQAVEKDDKALAIPRGKDAADGQTADQFDEMRTLNTELPFLMAMHRKYYEQVGGFDEDFTGHGRDDVDLVGRLKHVGCHYIRLPCRCIHLYHPLGKSDPSKAGLVSNMEIYRKKKGIIERNKGKQWGQI